MYLVPGTLSTFISLAEDDGVIFSLSKFSEDPITLPLVAPMCQAITFNKRLLSDMFIAYFRQMVWPFLFRRRLEKDGLARLQYLGCFD